MPINTVDKPPEIYQIKVTLVGTVPPIWRRLLVRADLTLEQLHNVLQLAMGWEGCHMHEFRIGKQSFGKPDPMEHFLGGLRTVSERTAYLFTVLGKARAKALYTYDFGDSWDHEIVVEKCLAPEPGRTYPVCLAGKRRAPPEDSGGIPGFYNLLEAFADPEHEQHEESIEWLGDDFDPDTFSVDEVNQRLALRQRHRKETVTGKN
jgi:Plasmid pRiA4b ORF-3-like protein